MLPQLKPSGPVEAVVIVLASLVAIGGAVLVAVSPHTLSADQYANTVIPGIAALLGPTAVAKGIRLHGLPVSVAGAEKLAPEIEQLAAAAKDKNLPAVMAAIEQLIPTVELPSDRAEDAEPPPGPPDPAQAQQTQPPAGTAHAQQPVDPAELARAQAVLERAKQTGQA